MTTTTVNPISGYAGLRLPGFALMTVPCGLARWKMPIVQANAIPKPNPISPPAPIAMIRRRLSGGSERYASIGPIAPGSSGRAGSGGSLDGCRSLISGAWQINSEIAMQELRR